jgi:hypothetical protein
MLTLFLNYKGEFALQALYNLTSVKGYGEKWNVAIFRLDDYTAFARANRSTCFFTPPTPEKHHRLLLPLPRRSKKRQKHDK